MAAAEEAAAPTAPRCNHPHAWQVLSLEDCRHVKIGK